MLRTLAPDVTYFTGLHTPRIAATARRRGDIGLVITPDHNAYAEDAADYPALMVDNGAFSQKGFRPGPFERLLKRITANPEVKRKIWFVVTPDVVCNHTRTLELFNWWEPRIHALGLPCAFVAQNGVESRLDEIPWDRMDTLFLGGSTAWKEGDFGQELWTAEQGLERIQASSFPQYAGWLRMLEEADERQIPIHMGRVNSLSRMELAHVFYDMRSSDGTMLKFQQTERLRQLEGWLDWLNHGTGPLVEPRQKPRRQAEGQLALWEVA